MQMKYDGVDIYCLPEGARCCEDEEGRNPLDIDKCPIGHNECSGDCEFYTEDY